MREIRRRILNGENVSECDVCYEAEKITSTSYRTAVGLTPLYEPLDLRSLKDECIRSEYARDHNPGYIKLELGNLCNLKCRMCYGWFSSEVERDPVHTMWVGGAESLHAIWDDDRAVIGPEPRIGVASTGLHGREKLEDDWFNWTDGHAHFDVSITRATELESVVIGLSHLAQFDRFCRILLNDRGCFEGRVNSGTRQIAISLKNVGSTDRLTIDILSEAEFNKSLDRNEGVAITSIHLQKLQTSNQGITKEVIASRHQRPGLWYNKKEVLCGELLADLGKLKRLYITGGEPFLEPKFAELVDHLISKGAAKNIDLEVTTNATLLNEGLLEKLKSFNSLYLMVSIDGVGAVHEYIRYPARWSVIEKNLRSLRDYGFAPFLVPVVQAYNMLSLADIYRFSRDLGIGIGFNVLQDPKWLGMSVMPLNCHRLAARRLREILDNEKFEENYMQGQIEPLIRNFESFNEAMDHEGLRTFNIFTNDLDSSRGQNFKQSLPELYNLILECGYKWTDETRYADSGQRRKSSQDRLHAWV
jgi:glutamate-1-semialdehyde 2,1-aminomutase